MTRDEYDARRMARRVVDFQKWDAPDGVKAHFVVRVLMPKMARWCGVKDFAAHLSALLTEGMALWTGVCPACLTAKADSVEDNLCAVCRSKQDQFEAECDKQFREQYGDAP